MVCNVFQMCCKEEDVSKLSPPFDAKSLLDTYDNDKEFVSELLQLCLQSFAEYIVKLEAAEDIENVKSTAHALKGSGANLECLTLQRVAADLEEHTYTSNDIEQMREKISAVITEAHRVLAHINSSELEEILS